MKTRRLRPVIALFCTVTIIASALLAAPVGRDFREVPDELRVVANIKQLRVDVALLPAVLTEADVTRRQILEQATAKLTEVGFEVVEDEQAPLIMFTASTLEDPAMPDIIAYTVFVDVVQKVHLYRLEEDVTVPTATVSVQRLAKRSELVEELDDCIDQALDHFIRAERIASENVK